MTEPEVEVGDLVVLLDRNEKEEYALREFRLNPDNTCWEPARDAAGSLCLVVGLLEDPRWGERLCHVLVPGRGPRYIEVELVKRVRPRDQVTPRRQKSPKTRVRT